MEDTQDLIFEIEGNVGSVGSSDLLGVVSLVMTGGTEALHLGKTSDSFEQQTGKKAKTVSRSLARTTTNIWETGNKKILRQVYSNHLPVERPTPKNFIIRLAEYLKRQTIRKQDTPLNGLERNETIPKEPNVHQMPCQYKQGNFRYGSILDSEEALAGARFSAWILAQYQRTFLKPK